MRLRVRGHSKLLTPIETRKIMEFFAKELLGPRLARRITVNLEWKAYPREWGSVDWADRNHRPRVFAMAVHPKMTLYHTLQTLAHEMVHVKQFARGDMKDFLTTARCSRWKKRIIDHHDTPYAKLPWEVEAYRMQKILYRKLKEHLKNG